MERVLGSLDDGSGVFVDFSNLVFFCFFFVFFFDQGKSSKNIPDLCGKVKGVLLTH